MNRLLSCWTLFVSVLVRAAMMAPLYAIDSPFAGLMMGLAVLGHPSPIPSSGTIGMRPSCEDYTVEIMESG